MSKCAGGFKLDGSKPCARCGALPNQVCKEHYAQLHQAAALAREALDHLMGDSDLPEDDSKEMKAMQALSAALGSP